ncbi:metallophosphoesterase [Selenomonas sp. GACV-9]|uniref:metallophosphoesterase family protein n=1 Tax=Selenomonas sp. GACV-9 TaxID=3158782 RepID=UPI00296EF2B1
MHTPPLGSHSYTALIFPDSQSSDYSDWSALAHTAWQRHPEAQFFINMGDIVDNGEDHTQWQAWFDGVEPMIAKIPFAPIMGNHETYDQNWKVRLPEAYLHYFDVPENQSATFSRYYYSFDHGAVHFIVLNSQWDETNDFKPGLLDEQLAWLKDDTQKSTAKWKVVLIHKDVLQYRIKKRPERKEGISAVGRAFMPLFDELGIDLVLTAHLHTYRNRGRLYDKQPSTDKGPLYILTGVAGNVRYPNLWTGHAFDKVVAPQPETDNYLTLAVTDSSLTVTCFLPDGQEIDRACVTK